MTASFRLRTAGLLLAVLAAAPAAAADLEGALALMPADSAVVVGANLDRFRKAPIFKDFQQLIESQAEGKQALDKLKEAGLDPRTNLDTVFIALPAGMQKAGGPLILFPGRGDLKKMLSIARAEGAKVTPGKYKGVETFTTGEGNGKGVVSVVKGHLVMGPEPMVHGAIDASKGGKSASGNARVQQLIKGVETGRDFWAVLDVTGEVAQQVAQGGPDAKSLKGGRASLDFATGLGLRVALDFADDASATKLADMVRAELTKASADPGMTMLGLADAMKKASVKSAGKQLDLTLDLTPAELDRVKAMMMAMSGMMKAGQAPGAMPPPGAPEKAAPEKAAPQQVAPPAPKPEK